MAHKFKIDAVHIHTSNANHMEHHKSPNIQIWNGKKNDKRINL